MTKTLAIVGGGLASARIVQSYREAGGDDRIVLISADDAPPYHRPPLSKRYLRGEAEAADTLVEPADFYAAHDVDLRLGTIAVGLDVGARQLRLAGGAEVAWDRLVIATGAWPRRLAGAHSLRTLADSTAIRERARSARTALVIGGGFVGAEVAASLRTLGLDVTLASRTPLFAALQAPALSEALADLYRGQGVELLLGGETPPATADLVVAGIGVYPATDLAEDGGLEVDDGIVVDERFRTSAPDVFAVGDVARFHDPIFGRRRRIEHWSNASYQGTELGRQLATGEGAYDTVSSFFSEVFWHTFSLVGDTTGHDQLVVRGNLAEDGAAVYLAGGRVVAALMTGSARDGQDGVKELIRAGADAEAAFGAVGAR